MTVANIQLLLKRGNTSVSSVYTGPIGELTLDTTTYNLRIHDGVTAGGIVADIHGANVGMKGYVDAKITANIAALLDSTPAVLDTLNELAAAINDDASFSVTITNMIASTNSNVTIANTNMKGYVDGQITSVNSAVTLANTIQSAQISAANVGMLGYVNSINTTLTSNAATQSDLIIGINANVTQANLGMKGYVDSVANQSIYGNSNVKSYLTGGFDGSIMPSANVTYDLGSHTYRWRDLWLSGSTINLGSATLSVSNGALYSSLPFAANITATNITVQGTRIEFASGGYIEESEVAGSPGTYGLALNSSDDGIVGMNALDSNALVTSSIIVSNVAAQINVANPNPAGNVLVWMFDQNGTLTLPSSDFNASPAPTSTSITFTGNGAPTATNKRISDTQDDLDIWVDDGAGSNFWRFGIDGNLRLPFNSGIIFGYGGTGLTHTRISAENEYFKRDIVVHTGNLDASSNHAWTFGSDGDFTFPNGTIQTAAFNNTAPIITTLIANAAAQSDLIIGINANVTQANLGMLGYVNSVASQSIYSNVNVQAYTETMSFTNFSNVNVAAYLSTQGITSYSNVQVATYLPTYTGNIGATVNGYSIGYRDVPQVSAGNVTLSATDSGKHYYSTATAPTTLTVPSNANVAFATGTAITIINAGTGNITIDKQVEASLYMAGNATSASRTLTSYGMATLLKTASDQWFINGTGLN